MKSAKLDAITHFCAGRFEERLLGTGEIPAQVARRVRANTQAYLERL